MTFFTFTPKDVDHHMKLIRGKKLSNDNFVEKVYPYPNAIIDMLNEKDELMFIYEELEEIPIFYSTNERENQLYVLDRLLKEVDQNIFIPTKIVTNTNEVLDFLKVHEKIIISHPYQFEEKYVLTLENGSNYELSTQSRKRQLTQLTTEYFLKDILKESNMIIQKYYEKPEFNEIPYSYKIKLMRNHKDEWEYTSISPLYEISFGQSPSLATDLDEHLKMVNPINHKFSLKKLEKFGEELASILNDSELDLYDVNAEVIFNADENNNPYIVHASKGKVNEINFKEAVKLIEQIKRF